MRLFSLVIIAGGRTKHAAVSKKYKMLSEQQASQNSPLNLYIDCLYVMFGFSGSSEPCLRVQTDRAVRSCIIFCLGPNTRLESSQRHKCLRSLQKINSEGSLEQNDLSHFKQHFSWRHISCQLHPSGPGCLSLAAIMASRQCLFSSALNYFVSMLLFDNVSAVLPPIHIVSILSI